MSVSRVIWVALVLAAAAFAFWPYLGDPDQRTDDPGVLLDAEAVLRSDGTEFAFTVRQPSRVRIRVVLPMGLEGRVRVGPAAPAAARDIAYVPRAEDEFSFEAGGMAAETVERTIMAVGPYFVRIEPIPVAMGDSDIRVRTIVEAFPLE